MVEGGDERSFEKVRHWDYPLSAGSDSNHLRAQRQHRGGMIVGRVAVGEVAAHGSHVADQRVGDNGRCVVENRILGLDDFRTVQVRLPREAANT